MLLVFNYYTAEAEGSVLRLVCCEHCATQYLYLLYRHSVGQGTTMYNLTATRAARYAEEKAQRKVENALEREADPVPCPQCGLYQRHMFPYARALHRGWLKWAGVGALCLVPLMWLFVSLWWASVPANDLQSRLLLFCGVPVLLAVMFFAFRWVIPYNPNRRFENHRFQVAEERAVTREEFERQEAQRVTKVEVTRGDRTPSVTLWVRRCELDDRMKVQIQLPHDEVAAVQLSPSDDDNTCVPVSRITARYPSRAKIFLRVYPERPN